MEHHKGRPEKRPSGNVQNAPGLPALGNTVDDKAVLEIPPAGGSVGHAVERDYRTAELRKSQVLRLGKRLLCLLS